MSTAPSHAVSPERIPAAALPANPSPGAPPAGAPRSSPRPAMLALALALALLALYALTLATGAGPPVVRLTAVWAGLVLLPGFALSLWLAPRQGWEWPERWAAATGLGLALHGVLALAADRFGFDFRAALWALPILGLVAVAASGLRPRARPREPSPGEPGALASGLLLGATLVFLAVWAGRHGAPAGPIHDGLDHVATLYRMLLGGEVFPRDALYAGAEFADPRKGLFHAVLANLAQGANLRPLETWRHASFLLSPFLALAAYVLGRRVAGSRGAGALAALLVVLAYGGGLGGLALREAPYPMRLADALGWLAIWAALEALVHGGIRRGVGVALFAFAAVTTHVFAAFALGFALLALAIGLLLGHGGLPETLRYRSRRRWLGGFGRLGAWIAAACAPYLWLRWLEAYAPADPVHLEPQGLLYWWSEAAFTVDPRLVWDWVGWPGLAVVVALPFLWRMRRAGLGPLYLASTGFAALLVAFNPLLLPWLERGLGYLVLRVVWVVPVAVALSTALWLALRELRRSETRFPVAATATVVAGVIGLVPAGAGAARALAASGPPPAAGAREPLSDLMAVLRERRSAPTVVLADPPTAYAIPARTGHHVVAVMPQHGSPNDPRGRARLVEARDALSPFVGARERLELLRAHGVDLIVVNGRHERAFPAGPVVIQPDLYERTLSSFRERPEHFREIWSRDRLHLFELTDAGRTGPLPEAQVPVRPWQVEDALEAAETGFVDGPFLHLGTRASAPRIAPGDTLWLTSNWTVREGGTVVPGTWIVATHLVRRLPAFTFYHPAYGKPYRELMESIGDVRYRLRSNHVPIEGYEPPDRWRPGEIVADRFPFPIPENAATGNYEIRVRMRREPHHANVWLADFFRDEDRARGPVVGRVTVSEEDDA